MRRLFARWGIGTWVWLIDFDGTRHLRLKRSMGGGQKWAIRVSGKIRWCMLNVDGTVCDDRCYVERWEDFVK